MIGVYTLLNKKAKKRPSFEKTEEFKFFIDHRYILEKYPKFSFLYDSDDNEFNIMRANIILRGLLNKEIIEDEIDNINSHMQSGVKVDHAKFVSTLREVTIDLPYLVDDKIRIYIISHYLGIFAYGNFTKVLRRFYIIFYFNDNAQTGCAVSS